MNCIKMRIEEDLIMSMYFSFPSILVFFQLVADLGQKYITKKKLFYVQYYHLGSVFYPLLPFDVLSSNVPPGSDILIFQVIFQSLRNKVLGCWNKKQTRGDREGTFEDNKSKCDDL